MNNKNKIRRVPAKKIAHKIINECDVILMVVDGRNPEGTRNMQLEERIKKEDKKMILVLNKADLVPKHVIEKWSSKFKQENPNTKTVFVSSTNKKGTKILRDDIKYYLQINKINEGKVGVVGYPNVGKSSLINALTGKTSALSGLTAGLTKGEQWIKLTKKIKLLDTPGVIEPKDEDELVMIGAIRYEKIENPVDPAIKILKLLGSFDMDIVRKYCGDTIEINDVEEINEKLIEKIGKKFNFLGKNGIIDMKRTAKYIIKDYQGGKLNYYEVKKKSREQIRSTNIGFITKHLKDFLFIDDANAVVSHLSDISELSDVKVRKPIIGSKKIDDATVIISFGEKTANAGRKKVEEKAKTDGITLYSQGGGRCGKNRIFIGVGE
ncbi:GTP-binding protein HSR1-related [Methanococcus aeolicus Nankai-3]|uniref:GTP-binding protein HSR1-related n=1 Tax=Methanococcus aeolicus (strain ATCC BAA-1280 / DSM 17508 / OCM 812 / Nankai-3) TaxID=419665 RepID=A6UW99_META3|nr:GTPase [Methanococcus aeolicus]ABR56771.1 GTP-binding protein HSR1-related [Methanococcus aeolicus Nankai-3]